METRKYCSLNLENFLHKYKNIQYKDFVSEYTFNNKTFILIEIGLYDITIKDKRESNIESITINMENNYLSPPIIENFGVSDKFKGTGLAKLIMCIGVCICYELLKDKYNKNNVLEYPIELLAGDKELGSRKNTNLPKNYVLDNLDNFKLVKYYMKNYGFRIKNNLIMENTIGNLLNYCN